MPDLFYGNRLIVNVQVMMCRPSHKTIPMVLWLARQLLKFLPT